MGKSSFKSTRLHPSGNPLIASLKPKKGRKKHIRFVDHQPSSSNNESSTIKRCNRTLLKVGEATAKPTNRSCDRGDIVEQALTSDSDTHLSSIEDVNDINSIYTFDR